VRHLKPKIVGQLGGNGMEEYRRIRAALVGHSDEVFDLLAMQLAYLGSKEEWSVDDNLDTTEKLVRLAEEIGLHPAGDQDASALEFYRAASDRLGMESGE
jgi:hypothetical protein